MRLVDERRIPGRGALYAAVSPVEPGRPVEFTDLLESDSRPGGGSRRAISVSTSFGCPVGCLICDVPGLGYYGALPADDILFQIETALGRRPSRLPLEIQFSRAGEPSLNPQVLAVLRRIGVDPSLASARVFLSSTAPKSPAIAPFFEEMIAVKDRFFRSGRFRLQFSVHSTDESRRRAVIPIKKWGLAEISDYGELFFRPGDGKIELNFALGSARDLEASTLASIFDPAKFLVKLGATHSTAAASRLGLADPWGDPPQALLKAAARARARGFEVVFAGIDGVLDRAGGGCGQRWLDRRGAAWPKRCDP